MLLYSTTFFHKISAIPIVSVIFSVLLLVCILYYYYSRFNSRKSVLEREIERQKQIVNKQSSKLSRIEVSKAAMFRNMMEKIESPLSSIIKLNNAIMSNSYGSANANIKGASRIAVENGKQLIQLVEEVLELASFEMVSLELDKSPIYFYPYICELYHSLLAEAQSKNIHIGFNYQLDKDLVITLDSKKFEKVFKKLIRNAIHCSPKNSQVIISLEESTAEGKINLMVEDSGVGLDQDDLHNIFDCYFQSEYKNAFYSYGLVPALIRNYADLFDAELSVDSEVGRGTTFTFSFPKSLSLSDSHGTYHHKLAHSKPDTTHQQLPAYVYNNSGLSKQAGSAKKYRCLIVGDNEEVLQLIKTCIEDSYHILFARESEEARELLCKYGSKIDFIICSGLLPFMNEFQLLSEVKSNEKWNKLPLFVVTDEVKVSFRIRSLIMGIDDYLISPFHANELLSSIEKVLKSAGERDEWHLKLVACNKIEITDADLAWLTELEEIMQKEMSNRQFNIAELAYRMASSERQLFRKVKELTGKTPNKYLRELRMYSAKKLLENYSYDRVDEISYAVGFQDPHYFSKVYKAQFGKWPSDYLLKAQVVS